MTALVRADADAIAVSSYQGGHVEFFRYLIDSLRRVGAEHIAVFGGGGGTITAEEAAGLEAYGVERIFDAEAGRALGLEGMGREVMSRTRAATRQRAAAVLPNTVEDHVAIGRCLSLIEAGGSVACEPATVPVIGFTGTGGAGKSSVMDELLMRMLRNFPELHIAILAIDPTRYKSGGALLGDRIRLNSLAAERIYMRSMATRRRDGSTNISLKACVEFLKSAGFGLVLVETAGIGQADVAIVEYTDLSLYIMTAEFGAPTQLEKIQMLDYADMVVLNKFDKRGAADALRDIRRQWRRDHKAFDMDEAELPVYATVANHWHDPGLSQLFTALCDKLNRLPGQQPYWQLQQQSAPEAKVDTVLIPSSRNHYLAQIADQGMGARAVNAAQVEAAGSAWCSYQTLKQLSVEVEPLQPCELSRDADSTLQRLVEQYNGALAALSEASLMLLREWPGRKAAMQADQYSYTVRGQTLQGDSFVESLSGLQIPKVSVPSFESWGEQLSFLLQENLPGSFPFTAGVFPYRRDNEDPTRMFAGEGTPERTNRRFHYLAAGQKSVRLSTAFDPITLYGEDADPRPDIYGRIGMSGVSITNLDDMKKLYSGFDLCKAGTSVSMTINGPAPVLLAWFLNTAVDQQVELYLKQQGRWEEAVQKIKALFSDQPQPTYNGNLPEGHDGLGLAMLGVSGDELVDADTYARIREQTLSTIRGTLQADILKEDQAQNECIFPLELGMRMMGDIQAYFIEHRIVNYYSVSVSGYHIAEAGANPVTQLAFTLANGFTLVEYYLARGMKVDDFAPQMSFFFSNGMDPEYAVIGRVARRIWARAMRDIYGAGERSQKLKYHIQTSGRTLHAQTLDFNDIRTTLQALYAIYDNCNSLHTNAYDEALTTPTEASVRRALAIQMIINRELGLNFNQNPLQGAYIIEQLTDLVEEAVYAEFGRLSERGGVLGAMETLYQRGRIQDQSLYYEQKKHNATLPIIGVNTFMDKQATAQAGQAQLIRSAEEERRAQIDNVGTFKRRHVLTASEDLAELQRAVLSGENTFAVLMDRARRCTLGQITHALFDIVGGYRRRI